MAEAITQDEAMELVFDATGGWPGDNEGINRVATVIRDRFNEIVEAKLVEVRARHVLLPPATVTDQRYLEGWCEGQAYLIANYGSEEQFDVALKAGEALADRDRTIAEQAAEIARLMDDESAWGQGFRAGENKWAEAVAEQAAVIERVRAALSFVEPRDDSAMRAAVADDLRAGMSLRKVAAKHGTTVAVARGVAKAALGGSNAK